MSGDIYHKAFFSFSLTIIQHKSYELLDIIDAKDKDSTKTPRDALE